METKIKTWFVFISTCSQTLTHKYKNLQRKARAKIPYVNVVESNKRKVNTTDQ